MLSFRIDDTAQAWRDGGRGLFNVAVAGEFSTGKSSLLNLVAHAELLPVGVGFSGLPRVRLTWGPGKALYVVAGGERLPVTSFANQLHLHRPDLDHLEVEYPTAELAGLAFTEVPLAPGVDFETEVLPSLIEADMVVWCTSANQAWKHSELTAIDKLPPDLLARSVLVATRADLLTPAEVQKVHARLQREAGARFGAILFLSAARRIVAASGDPEIWRQSGGQALFEVIDARVGPRPDPDAMPDTLNTGTEIMRKRTPKRSSTTRRKSAAAAPPSEAAPKSTSVDAQSVTKEDASLVAQGAKGGPGKTINTRMEKVMKEQDLSPLKDLRGFIGACLVDSESGIMLGNEGGGSLDLEVAGAANAEVVKAKNAAIKALGLKENIEDILISLTGQYHLIRPLSSNPQIFLYVALTRSESNLGLARASVRQLEGKLDMK